MLNLFLDLKILRVYLIKGVFNHKILRLLNMILIQFLFLQILKKRTSSVSPNFVAKRDRLNLASIFCFLEQLLGR